MMSSRVGEPEITALRLNSQRRAEAEVELEELGIADPKRSRGGLKGLLLKREKSDMHNPVDFLSAKQASKAVTVDEAGLRRISGHTIICYLFIYFRIKTEAASEEARRKTKGVSRTRTQHADGNKAGCLPSIPTQKDPPSERTSIGPSETST